MTVAFVHGLQGDDPHYWLTASLMKHFLANSNENLGGKTHSIAKNRYCSSYQYVYTRELAELSGRLWINETRGRKPVLLKNYFQLIALNYIKALGTTDQIDGEFFSEISAQLSDVTLQIREVNHCHRLSSGCRDALRKRRRERLHILCRQRHSCDCE
jgi:hypothetical protein